MPEGFWKFLGNLIASGYGLIAAVIGGVVILFYLVPPKDRYSVVDDFLNHPLVSLMLLVFILVVAALTVYVKKSEMDLVKMKERLRRAPRQKGDKL